MPLAQNTQTRFWLFTLTGEERATFIATFGGWALDGMDVMIYSFVISTLMAQWKMSQGQAGMLSTVALLLSAVGGWLAGMLADRFGRARILQVTILWFAVFTFLSGFTHSFSQLLVTRGLQGLGFGGEWAVGAVLMGEAIRAEHRGKAVGTVQAGWAIGWGAAATCYFALFTCLPPSVAWRVMFWIGILPSLLVFYIQGHVPEPEIFRRTRALEADQGNGARFLEIFSPALLQTTLLAALLAVGAQGGYYAITTWLPTYLKTTRGLSVLNTTAYLFVVITGSFFGYLVGAWLTDRIGRRRTLILYAVCSALATVGYTYFPDRECNDAGSGISARILCLRLLQPDRRLLHGVVSHEIAGLWPRLLLQCRTRHRSIVPYARWLSGGPHGTWACHLHLRRGGISRHGCRCYFFA